MTPHTLHLKLNGTHQPDWVDSHLGDRPRTPYLHIGSAARVRLLLVVPDGDAVLSASGLTDVTLEIFKDPSLEELLIAPDAVSVTTAAPLLADWVAGTGSYYTAEITLTEAETLAVLSSATAMDASARLLQAWLEVRATLSGSNILLGAGPVFLLRGSAGGTPPGELTVYYTAAQVNALLESRPAIAVSGGAGSFSLNGTTYYFPITTTAPA